jgi:hypothetical protein
MSVNHQPGEGQHTLVRIEHASWPGDAVRRVEFEDSDDERNDNIAGVGWCIRWALDALSVGVQLFDALHLAEALASLDWHVEGEPLGDEYENEQIRAMMTAASNVVEYRAEKRNKKREAAK